MSCFDFSYQGRIAYSLHVCDNNSNNHPDISEYFTDESPVNVGPDDYRVRSTSDFLGIDLQPGAAIPLDAAAAYVETLRQLKRDDNNEQKKLSFVPQLFQQLAQHPEFRVPEWANYYTRLYCDNQLGEDVRREQAQLKRTIETEYPGRARWALNKKIERVKLFLAGDFSLRTFALNHTDFQRALAAAQQEVKLKQEMFSSGASNISSGLATVAGAQCGVAVREAVDQIVADFIQHNTPSDETFAVEQNYAAVMPVVERLVGDDKVREAYVQANGLEQLETDLATLRAFSKQQKIPFEENGFRKAFFDFARTRLSLQQLMQVRDSDRKYVGTDELFLTAIKRAKYEVEHAGSEFKNATQAALDIYHISLAWYEEQRGKPLADQTLVEVQNSASSLFVAYANQVFHQANEALKSGSGSLVSMIDKSSELYQSYRQKGLITSIDAAKLDKAFQKAHWICRQLQPRGSVRRSGTN